MEQRVSSSERPLFKSEESASEESSHERALADVDESVDLILRTPAIRSHTSIEFILPEYEGRSLKPGRRLEFEIPEAMCGRIVRDVVLRHRKGEKYRVDIDPVTRHDPYGAYSRVEVHDVTSGEWRGWRDPKGYDPNKFAEPRPVSDPENEVLHDWVATVGQIKADAVRVTNVGAHPEYSTSQIHGLEVIFFPELEGVTYEQRIYCSGTSFIELGQDHFLPTYGGGSHTEGKYVGALALNQRSEALYDLGKDSGPGTRQEPGRLFVKIRPKQTLVQVEVAVGDTEHLREVSPKTQRRTRLGYAKLWVGIHRARTRNIELFIQNAN